MMLLKEGPRECAKIGGLNGRSSRCVQCKLYTGSRESRRSGDYIAVNTTIIVLSRFFIRAFNA